MMRTVFPLLTAVIFLTLDVVGQQVPLYSQYNVNPFLYNPAKTGERENLHAFLIYRKQWVDFQGAPETRALSLDGMVKDKIGLGGYIYTDYTDIIEKFAGYLNYAYYFKFAEDHKLSIGVAAGLQETRVNFDEVVVDDINEPLITGGMEKGLIFDASAGINYWFKGLQVGFSVPQIAETKLKALSTNEEAGYRLSRHYLATASYNIPVVKDVFYIEPGAMFRMAKGQTFQVDGNLALKYKEIFWVAGTYRYDYGVSVGGGIQVHDRVSVGYSYDISINSLKDFSGGTHEGFIGIKFGKKEDKGLVEAIQNLERKQEEQTQELTQLKEKADTLKDQNTELQKSLEQKETEYEELKEELENTIKEFQDSLKQAKKEWSSIESEVQEVQKKDLDFLTEVPTEKYFIVVGAFANQDNARSRAQEIKDQGYDAGIVFNKKKQLFYVYLFKPGTLKEGLNKVNELRDGVEFKDAWIYIYD